MTAEVKRLNERIEECIASSDYDGAKRFVDEALKIDASDFYALLINAKIECSKDDDKSILKSIESYRKALACKEASKEDNLTRIRAGLHKAIVSALFAACNEMLGQNGFEAYTRQKHFLSFSETLEKAIENACDNSVLSSQEVLKSMPMLLQKSATYMRNTLTKRAESSMEWLTEGSQYEDYKKSIDACIQIVDYSISRESDTARKVRGYEKIIMWLDARAFSATNEPTENASTGDTQYSLIETLSNPEMEQLSVQRTEYVGALEVQKYIQALELLKERSSQIGEEAFIEEENEA